MGSTQNTLNTMDLLLEQIWHTATTVITDLFVCRTVILIIKEIFVGKWLSRIISTRILNHQHYLKWNILPDM
jgi:hypothetical protein